MTDQTTRLSRHCANIEPEDKEVLELYKKLAGASIEYQISQGVRLWVDKARQMLNDKGYKL